MLEKIILFLIKVRGRKTLKKVLKDLLPRQQIRRLNTATWTQFQARKHGLPAEVTPGARLTVQLSLLTHIMYEQMLRLGLDHGSVLERSRQITRDIFHSHAMRAWRLAWCFRRPRIRRLEWLMHMAWKWFPYNAPGFDMREQPSAGHQFVFHVYRCPAAEYFHSKLLPELCLETWCKLDYGLAEDWRLKLERTGTLSSGAPFCDFVFFNE